MYKIAVLSSSTGTNLQSIIDAKSNVEISCFITNKQECGAFKMAKANNIPANFVDPQNKSREEYDQEVMNILDQYNPDLLVLGGYMRIISSVMIKAYHNRIINIHPSLLPKHPGMDLNVHQSVLNAGETETGMTIHFVDEGVDTGKIILQKSISVHKDDTAEILKEKVQDLEKEWYPKVVQMFADGKIK